MLRFQNSFLLVLSLLVLGGTSFAQNVPFSIRVQQPDFIATVGNGANVTVNTPQGTSDRLQVTLTYLGIGSATISAAPLVEGSTAFTIGTAGAVPAVLTNGQSFTYEVLFTPRRAEAVTAIATVNYTETITTQNGQASAQGSVVLGFTGTSPQFVVNYISPETQSAVAVQNGQSIPFAPTAVNGLSTVTLAISNRGSGTGELTALASNSPEFQIVGLPLLPLNIGANAELRVTLRFAPVTEGAKTGTLSVALDGVNANFELSGNAFRQRFAYELSLNGTFRDILPGDTLELGEALPGEILSAQVVVRNANPVDVTIPSIGVFGAGFGLSEVPTNRTLRPGEAASFFLQAALTQVGVLRGRLRVGEDAFDLQAIASGAQLRYSFRVGDSGSIALATGGAVFFPPTTITSSSEAVFTVRNSGISEASVVNISVADIAGTFSLPELPSLPVRIDPGQEIQFRILFKPSSAGSLSSTLRIDGANFTLSGTSSSLPALPGYRLVSSAASINPLEQPTVGLELTETYPLPITGQILLSQEPLGFVADPSVRFSNGTTTASFTIPANTTRAVFANGTPTVRFQTGSVAGEIQLRANFQVADVNLDDPNPSILRLNIAPAPPRIISGTTAPGANALTVVLTGLTVSRSLTQVDLELRPVEGFTLSQTQFSINLSGDSLAWFRSTASQTTGGVFLLQIPLNFSIPGNTSVPTLSNLIESLASIDVVLANEQGSSNRLTIPLR